MNSTTIDTSKFEAATSPIKDLTKLLKIEKQVLPKARRYNNGKLRYELIPHTALKDVAEVYTKGAAKYTITDDEGNIIDDGANNWRKGLSWTSMIGSVQRHIEAWKNGEDIDPDLGTKHLANAAWGLLGLLEYYKIHPEFDDRHRPYLNTLHIGLDIDGVIANWNQHLFDYNDYPIKDVHYWNCPVIDYLFDKVRTDEDFWLTIKPLISPQELPFEPACYITARTIPAEITQQWLNENGFPKAPLYCVGEGESKVNVALNANINLFIDDSYNNFVQLNNAGVTTLLYTQPYNKKYNVGHLRINNFDEFKQRFLQ